jgi:hypothetical protein
MSRESDILFGEESVQAAVLAPSGILKVLLKCIKIGPDTSQGDVRVAFGPHRHGNNSIACPTDFWKVAVQSPAVIPILARR